MADDRTLVAATLKELLDLIPEEPRRISTTDLVTALRARGHQRTARSVQRQLQVAVGMYPFVCVSRTKPFQYAWCQGRRQAALSNDPNAALALWLVFDHLGRILPPETVDLLRRQQADLDRTLSRPTARLGPWRSKVRVVPAGPQRIPPPVKPDVARIVYDALLSGRCLEIGYCKRGATQPRTHVVHPLGLVLRGSGVLVICRFEGKESAAQIQLHRVVAARRLAQAVVTPRGFDLDEYVARGGPSFVLGEPLDLELRILEGAVESFREAPLSCDQRLEDSRDGWWRLTARVPDTVDLRGLLMGYGDSLEVIGPPALRAYFVDQVQNLGRHYGVLPGAPETPPADLRVRAARARERKPTR